MLHPATILLKTFVVATMVARWVEEIETFENVVGERMSILCVLQWRSWPTLTALQPAVQFSETGDKLCLLLLKHLYIAFRIYLVLGLFTLSEYTNSVVCFASTAGASTIAL